MPEGPEVRKYANALDAALTGRSIVSLAARTKDARKWLHENELRIRGRRVERVVSHGKHLLGYIDGDFFFHSHLMMWGRWQTFGRAELPEKDRRERARIVVDGGAAILLSAPIFNAGEGDPYQKIEILNSDKTSHNIHPLPTNNREWNKSQPPGQPPLVSLNEANVSQFQQSFDAASSNTRILLLFSPT